MCIRDRYTEILLPGKAHACVAQDHFQNTGFSAAVFSLQQNAFSTFQLHTEVDVYKRQAYVITCCILCAMMVVTTFSFDENAKWEKYAMIMPISRKDLVLSKFVILLCFCLFGTVFGGVLGIAGSAIIRCV